MLQFPHRFDRYRLISIIFCQLSKRIPHFKQGMLERLTGIDQTTISRLLSANAMRKKAKQQRNLNRRHLLLLSRKGFGLSHEHASLVLWLAEGPAFVPWREGEFRSVSLTPPNPAVQVDLDEIRAVNGFRDEPPKAHVAAVNLLRDVFVTAPAEDGWQKIRTNILHGNSPQDALALYRKLRDMEYRGGQRMVVSQYPSILVSPALEANTYLDQMPDSVKGQLMELLAERKKIFKFNLERFGERAIHSVSSLKRFIQPNFKHPLDLGIRKKRLRGLIRCLERYPRFQIGLVPESDAGIEPEIEIAIKSTREAVIRGTSRDLSNHPQTIICGPSYLHWDNDWAVVTFYLDFENQWEKLTAARMTDKTEVLRTLEKMFLQS